MTRSDAELLKAASQDPQAFREFYDRYAVWIRSWFVRHTGNEPASLDLTAETFAQAWLVRRRFRDEAGGSAGPWLFAIARHVLSASVRRRRIEQSACARLGLLLPRETEAAQPTEVWLDGLDEALAGLTQGEHDAIRLRVLGDLEYDEVARELRTTPAAARVRVHRGLTKLRNRLTQRTEAAG